MLKKIILFLVIAIVLIPINFASNEDIFKNKIYLQLVKNESSLDQFYDHPNVRFKSNCVEILNPTASFGKPKQVYTKISDKKTIETFVEMIVNAKKNKHFVSSYVSRSNELLLGYSPVKYNRDLMNGDYPDFFTIRFVKPNDHYFLKNIEKRGSYKYMIQVFAFWTDSDIQKYGSSYDFNPKPVEAFKNTMRKLYPKNHQNIAKYIMDSYKNEHLDTKNGQENMTFGNVNLFGLNPPNWSVEFYCMEEK